MWIAFHCLWKGTVNRSTALSPNSLSITTHRKRSWLFPAGFSVLPYLPCIPFSTLLEQSPHRSSIPRFSNLCRSLPPDVKARAVIQLPACQKPPNLLFTWWESEDLSHHTYYEQGSPLPISGFASQDLAKYTTNPKATFVPNQTAFVIDKIRLLQDTHYHNVLLKDTLDRQFHLNSYSPSQIL